MMPTGDSVMRSIVLPVPPERPWDALTKPSELAEWLADEVVCGDGAVDETRVEFTLAELLRRETLLTVVESAVATLPAGWGPKLAAHTGAPAQAR